MALHEYSRKRRPGTPEPLAGVVSRGHRPVFVVQLHHASSRHYDFRLEMDGVLKSWAVPKGPSLRAGEKRLAVEVEDHPLDYAGFEGDIPEGHYGAGHVDVFDHGHWAMEGDPLPALARGKLDFTLAGEKLSGGWKLVRTGMQGKQRQWLLIKRDDAHASDQDADDLLGDEAKPNPRHARAPSRRRTSTKASAHGGRWKRKAADLEGARAKGLPMGFEPVLATPRDAPPAGEHWLHEIKWDGYRVLADLFQGKAVLRSRNGLDWTDALPEVTRAVEALPVTEACLDGELVVLEADGRSDFAELQRVLEGTSRARLRYLVFDLPGLAGVDLRDSPLVERKRLLQALVGETPGVVAYSDHIVGHGAKMFEETAKAGIEGVVSKRVDSAYRSGRSGDWVKSKHATTDEFAVVGFTEPKGARWGFGSLLVASPDGTSWRYMGRVGTGFDERTLAALHERLIALEQSTAPVELPAHAPFSRSSVTWVKPEVVVQLAYRGLGKEGLLRQSSFQRVRHDKAVGDLGGTRSSPAPQRSEGGHMPITHPDRRMFADSPYTKQDVADYYRAVADYLLPELVRRPLSLLRCPDGSQSPCFFQKHHADSLGPHVHAIALEQKSGREDYLYVDGIEGVLELVQMNTLELHPWGATTDSPETPDRLVFDLDPGDGVAWKSVVAAAREVRDRLGEIGLESFVRLSGGKGLHVVVPMRPGVDWNQARAFCEGFAVAMATQAPDRYLASMAKAKRKGRIFIDWLRNARGATSVASWSLRARPGAPVAVPLRWEELGRVAGPGAYDLDGARRRAARLKDDPWAGIGRVDQALPDFGV
ncbi:DNA ligase D [Marilutibacter aestuarii]|uniref:DNA ligase (ATP) n=1 Tax=Marilutibacter aestuarii TaxID=1706195 RepID=A0A508ACV5_9GAMM|nr:DNA ligase D [Lysobacter aestuarii]TQD46324.1 DNA ligase D [Lysobacter aestuarii]